MSTDNYDRTTDTPVTEQEGVMFGATPVWDRNRKRRGLGRKAPARAATTVEPEPRTFGSGRDHEEPMALDHPVTRSTSRPDQTTAYAMGAAAATPSARAADDFDDGLMAPIGRTSGRLDGHAKSRGIAPAAIAAGAVGLVALGAAGWFATRDSDGVPEMTPGAPMTEVATSAAPVVPAAADPTLTAQNVLPERTADAPVATPAEPPRQMARAERRAATPAARTRPATAAGADASGIDASTTAAIPSGPQPYSTLNSSTAPTTVNPAAPSTQPAPESIPSTPPTITPEPTPTPEAITAPTMETPLQ